MGRQRNIPQMKEQEKSPGKELDNQPDTDFKIMLKEFSENFNSMKKNVET